MTDPLPRYCLEYAATCETRRLLAGRSCCSECTHGGQEPHVHEPPMEGIPA